MSRVVYILLLLLTAVPQEPPRDAFGDPLPPGVTARLGTIRFRHCEDVFAVAFQPDGKVVIAVDYGWIHWWDASTGLPVRPPVKKEGRGFWATISGDSTRIATGEHRGPGGWMIGVYEAATGKSVRVFSDGDDFTGQPIGVALSNDGTMLAYAGVKGQACAWEVASGKKLADFKGHDGHVMSTAVSPDGRFVATSGSDKSIRFWNPKTGEETGRIDAPFSYVNLAISPDGSRIAGASSEDRAVRVWEVASRKELHRFEDKEEVNFHPRFSKDGNELVVTKGWATTFHDLATGRETRRVPHGGYSGAISADGRLLAAGGGNQVRLWDLKAGAPVRAALPSLGSDMIAWFSPDDSQVRFYTHQVHTWDLSTGKFVSTVSISKNYTHTTFSPDRRHYARSATVGRVVVCETATDREIATVTLGRGVWLNGIALSNGGSRLAVGDRNPPSVHLYDVATGAETTTLTGRGGGFQLAFSPDGGLLATEQEGGWIHLWNPATGDRKFSIRASEYDVGVMAFTADGNTLVAATSVGIGFWKSTTGEQVRTVPSDSRLGENFLAVSRCGRYVAGPFEDKEVKVWELATGGEVMHIKPDLGYAWNLAFSNSGTRLAVVAGDGNAHLWNLVPADRKGAALAELWEDLASKDAKRAHAAIGGLAHQGAPAVAFIKERIVRRPKNDDEARALLAGLGDEDLGARGKAARDLERLDAGPEYRRILEDPKLAPATAATLRALLGEMKPVDDADPDRLRRVRAITALSWNGSKEAAALLKEMADVVTDRAIREEASRAVR